MNKQQLSFLTGTLLLGVSMATLAGQPDKTDIAADETPDPFIQQASHDEALAHKMMGHISLAQMALGENLPDEARHQINRAKGLEQTLAADRPELTIDSNFEYGKITYDDESVVKSHYIPIIDDVLLVSDYAGVYAHGKTIDVDQTSAGVMHLSVSVDLREVKNGLDRASTAIDNRDYVAAESALADVFRNAIVDEQEVDDPKLLIAENLALARAFVNEGQYDSARLTLDHVKDHLKIARKEKLPGMNEATLDRFANELDDMRADLRKRDPSLLGRISARLHGWSDEVANWLS
ncbi:MAG: YfdX family protein [Woeseiaceae bacterium]